MVIKAVQQASWRRVRKDSEVLQRPGPAALTLRQNMMEANSSCSWLDNFEKVQELGRGRFGVVFEVRRKADDRVLAAKCVRTRKREVRDKVRDEANLLRELRDPHIVRYVDHFEDPSESVILTEYLSGGELFERVTSDGFNLTEAECILYVRQICRGAAYLHRQDVVHLDLKPENVMVCDRSTTDVKIVDFGLARRLRPGNEETRTLSGTPEFVAPEVANFDPVGPETDMWSVGVITYVLLSGLSPFLGDSDDETYANVVMASDLCFDDQEEFRDITEEAKAFIAALVVKNRHRRLSAAGCLAHPWLADDGVDDRRSKKLKTDNHRKYLARRRWQKCGQAIRAMKRISSLRISRGESAGSNPGSAGSRDSGFSASSGSPKRTTSLGGGRPGDLGSLFWPLSQQQRGGLVGGGAEQVADRTIAGTKRSSTPCPGPSSTVTLLLPEGPDFIYPALYRSTLHISVE